MSQENKSNDNDLPQTQNTMVQQSFLLPRCKIIFRSLQLLGFAMLTTLFIIFWRLSKASDGFASQDEETSFYRWMMVYFTVFFFQIFWWANFHQSDPNFVGSQLLLATLPLCIYVSFALSNNYGHQATLFGDSHGFSKLFCTIETNAIVCRVEVQQLKPTSISDCEAHNSSVKWDFCGTPCQSFICLHKSSKT